MIVTMTDPRLALPLNVHAYELTGVDGVARRIRGPSLLRLLARLCQEPGRVVSHADLVRAVYGEDALGGAGVLYYRQPLRNWIRMARALFRDAGYPRDVLIAYRGVGYKINLDALQAIDKD